jgi:hypothetical protein
MFLVGNFRVFSSFTPKIKTPISAKIMMILRPTTLPRIDVLEIRAVMTKGS